MWPNTHVHHQLFKTFRSREKPRSSSEQYHTSPLVVENKPMIPQSGANPPPWTPALSYQTESSDMTSLPDARLHVTSPQALRASQESVYFRNYNTLPIHAEVTEDGTTIYSCTTLPAQRTFSTFKPPPDTCYHLYDRSELTWNCTVCVHIIDCEQLVFLAYWQTGNSYILCIVSAKLLWTELMNISVNQIYFFNYLCLCFIDKNILQYIENVNLDANDYE